jgi:hypothetical protein
MPTYELHAFIRVNAKNPEHARLRASALEGNLEDEYPDMLVSLDDGEPELIEEGDE